MQQLAAMIMKRTRFGGRCRGARYLQEEQFLHGTTVGGVEEGGNVPVGVRVIVGVRVTDGVIVGRGVRVGNGVQVGSGVRVGVRVGGKTWVGVTSTSGGYS